MNYDPPIPILNRLAPNVQTRAGVAWRLYWLWPELRCLYLAALVAWAFAAFAAGGYFETVGYTGAGVFAPMELAVFVPLLYIGFLGGAPNGGYAVGCGRALAMLPVQRTRIRDAVWFIDVPSAALLLFAFCGFVALVLPSPGPHKAWFFAATVIITTLYAGGRAVIATSGYGPLRGAPQGKWERFARYIDLYTVASSFLAIIAMFFAIKNPLATGLAVPVALISFAWSFLRRPAMAVARGDGTTRKQRGGPSFSSGKAEIIRLFALPFLVTLCLIAAIAAVFLVFRSDKPGEIPYFMIVLMTGGLGQLFAMRVRASRVLPLSTRTMTLAVLASGMATALPLVLFMAVRGVAGPLGLNSLLILSSTALFMTALTAGGIWGPFYTLRWTFAYMALAMFSAVTYIGMRGTTLLTANTGNAFAATAITALLLAIVAWSIERKFWSDSKVYRHQFQQPQGQAPLANLSGKNENLLLGLALLTTIVGVLCGIVWLAGGGA
jgi:hypothetical protein